MLKLRTGICFVVLCLAGCNPGTPEPPAPQREANQASGEASAKVKAFIDDINAMEAKTTEAIKKADNLDAFTAAIEGEERSSAIDAIRKKFSALSESERKELQTRPAQLQAGAEKLQEAINGFHKRMIEKGGHSQVVIDTSAGPIKLELYETLAPITVKNFLRYTDEKFYDGTIFHRVIPTFMIQGGGFTPDMKEKDTHAAIKNESFNRLSNARGTIAMARTNAPNSATAQFYLNVAENKPLDRDFAQDGVGYAVFGKVIEGMDVVDKIKNVPTATRNGHDDVPTENVIIKSVRRIDEKK